MTLIPANELRERQLARRQNPFANRLAAISKAIREASDADNFMAFVYVEPEFYGGMEIELQNHGYKTHRLTFGGLAIDWSP